MRTTAPGAVPIACLLALACGPGEPAAERPPPSELPAAVLRNATFPNPYVDAGQVRLEHGSFGDTAQRVSVMLLPEYAVGDLDQDGSPDAAAILATNAGGSGTFIDLIAVLNRDGAAVPGPSLFLGDRVLVERIRIHGAEITLDLTVHGPADPMCCPTEPATRRFRLAGDRLTEVDPVTGESGSGS